MPDAPEGLAQWKLKRAKAYHSDPHSRGRRVGSHSRHHNGAVQPAGAFSAAGHEFGGLWDPLKSRLRARLSQPDHHSLTPAEGKLLGFKHVRVDVRMEHQKQLVRSGSEEGSGRGCSWTL
jgi:hypothetical protein